MRPDLSGPSETEELAILLTDITYQLNETNQKLDSLDSHLSQISWWPAMLPCYVLAIMYAPKIFAFLWGSLLLVVNWLMKLYGYQPW